MNQIGDMCASSCSAPEPGYSMELGEANAKLAAAAPDLLAACRAADKFLDDTNQTGDVLDVIRAALSKAEGGA